MATSSERGNSENGALEKIMELFAGLRGKTLRLLALLGGGHAVQVVQIRKAAQVYRGDGHPFPRAEKY
jgi:hypothetical protein